MKRIIEKLLKNKTVRICILFVALGLGMFYLYMVFAFGLVRNIDNIWRTSKQGYKFLTVPNECRQILKDADLQPYGNHHPVEFHEYGNLWAWDSAKTLMYKSSVMEHPQCLNFLIQKMVAADMRYILVIYDCEKKSEVMVIRNYNK